MKRFAFAPLAAALLLSAPAGAVVLSIDPILATWSNVVGAPVTPTGNGTDTAEIRWGEPATDAGQSGYRFAAASTPVNTTVVVDGASATFNLGTFTHFNNPIFAPSITSARLTITYGVSVDGNFLNNYNAVFNFLHDETPNPDNPCLFGGDNGAGVNSNGCADRVRVGLNENLTQFFTINDVNYTLDISGFSVGGDPFSQFLTQEASTNNAILLGRIAAQGFTNNLGIPEPSSWAMMLLGFGAIGLSARRRRTVVTA
jgi:hypothetical protein